MRAAAREAGVGRIVAQSYASHRYARVGGPVKTEEGPLDPRPPHPESVAAMALTDEAVTKAGGIALRYESFYGDPEGASSGPSAAGNRGPEPPRRPSWPGSTAGPRRYGRLRA